jgi:hypothetical protein
MANGQALWDAHLRREWTMAEEANRVGTWLGRQRTRVETKSSPYAPLCFHHSLIDANSREMASGWFDRTGTE